MGKNLVKDVQKDYTLKSYKTLLREMKDQSQPKSPAGFFVFVFFFKETGMLILKPT